jgi:hypothetical protein
LSWQRRLLPYQISRMPTRFDMMTVDLAASSSRSLDCCGNAAARDLPRGYGCDLDSK